MTGEVLGHYRILERIGAGGMGEVYRARDETLGRDVAIKVLPRDALANESVRKRFRKEALVLSKLNHPNIAFLFELGSEAGAEFMVVEYVGGLTLGEKLSQGPLPEKEVARVGVQLADGLAAAHSQGVVHCDLKPGNLRLTPDGRLKILDFGIARLLRPMKETAKANTTTDTTTGEGEQGAVGTLPYMAPEQLMSERLDGRTDIYATGVVLYEMATGQRPFREDTTALLIEAILHQPPVGPRALNRRVSESLERIILKCLQKEPIDRYQSGAELEVDLRQLMTLGAPPKVLVAPRTRSVRRGIVAAGVVAVTLVALGISLKLGTWRRRFPAEPGPAPITSLAVLPLENLSVDPSQDYFAEGMTDELITNLAQIGQLRVISRTSVMVYKRTRKRLPEIARELGVSAVVEGTVLRSGNRVRITAQLIDAATDRNLWAASYERDLRDVLDMQAELARDIAAQIQIKLTPQEHARLAGRPAVEPEVYEDYLRGRYYWNQRSEEGLRKAIRYFQQALMKDPNYALAYAGLADCYNVLGGYSDVQPKDIMPKAKQAALKALEIDGSLAEAHTSLGSVYGSFDWNWSLAESEYQRAIELNPNYSTAHQWYAVQLAALGRLGEAKAEIKRAQDLDPLSLIVAFNAGEIAAYARNYAQATEEFKKIIELDPNFAPGHQGLAWVYDQIGRHDEAIGECQKALALSGNGTRSLAALGYSYGISGKNHEAREVFNGLRKRARQEYVNPYYFAEVCAGEGEKGQAIQWLEKAYQDRSSWLAYLKVEPRMNSLRSDPRFRELMQRIGLPL